MVRIEFNGVELFVEKGIYRPSPESIELITYAVEIIVSENHTRVIDVGTGSGAIALVTMNELRKRGISGVHITGTDTNPRAIYCADKAAIKGKFTNVNFQIGHYVSDLTCPEPDFIIANLPYGNADLLLASNKIPDLVDIPNYFHPNGKLASYEELLTSIEEQNWRPRVVCEVGPVSEDDVQNVLGEYIPRYIQRGDSYGIVDIEM